MTRDSDQTLIDATGPSLEKLFSLNAKTYRECQDHYRGPSQQEYYLGDFWIARERPVTSYRKQIGPVSIIRQLSETNLFFRRNWQHIRKDAIDLSILWFVRRGKLSISTSTGAKIAGEGELAITRSTSPLFVQCETDEQGIHEVLHATIPSHLLRAHLQVDLSESLVIPNERSEVRIAERILEDVFEHSGLAASSANLLVTVALKLIAAAITPSHLASHGRLTIAEQRYRNIQQVVQLQLANPGLTPRLVAASCGISIRYLSSILHDRGTTLSKLMWATRLEVARNWLETSNPQDISVAEVCYSLGFKSAAHFSRAFKRRFGINPKDVRSISTNRDEGEGLLPSSSSGRSTLQVSRA